MICRAGALCNLCACKMLAFYFRSVSHTMICLLFSYPGTFRSVIKIGFSKSAKVTELMLLNLLASQDVALAALLHGGLFDYCFIDIRRCAAASSCDTVGAEKAFGEMILLDRADCLVSDDGFCGAFELAAYQNDLKPA